MGVINPEFTAYWLVGWSGKVFPCIKRINKLKSTNYYFDKPYLYAHSFPFKQRKVLRSINKTINVFKMT